ncbi:hypothetical protein KEM52_003536, partial [Ascosphaera acerosa]
MTARGWQRWLTLMVQAFPDQEHARLDHAVATLEIYRPHSKTERYPAHLPRMLLPREPVASAHAALEQALRHRFGIQVPALPLPPQPQHHHHHRHGDDPALAVARRHRSPAATSRRRSVSRGRAPVPPRINIPSTAAAGRSGSQGHGYGYGYGYDDDEDQVYTTGGPGVGSLSAETSGALGTLASPIRSRPSSMAPPSAHQRLLTQHGHGSAESTSSNGGELASGRPRRTT